MNTRIKCGDNIMQLYSRNGRTYVTKVRTNSAVSRLAKQRNIALARW